MNAGQVTRLFELADRVLAVARLIHAAKEPAFAAESWTPLESAVMRAIDRSPGTTAGEAAEATRLISSNFSRALRSLERKGLVRRESDPQDARRVRLHPTEKAHDNLQALREIWSDLLGGIVSDPTEIDVVVGVLHRIETEPRSTEECGVLIVS